jgi:hypothetical protein
MQIVAAQLCSSHALAAPRGSHGSVLLCLQLHSLRLSVRSLASSHLVEFLGLVGLVGAVGTGRSVGAGGAGEAVELEGQEG